jgi:hypothetical protein
MTSSQDKWLLMLNALVQDAESLTAFRVAQYQSARGIELSDGTVHTRSAEAVEQCKVSATRAHAVLNILMFVKSQYVSESERGKVYPSTEGAIMAGLSAYKQAAA